MIIITQPRATEEQIERIVARVREFGLEPHISRGASRVIIGVVGPEDLAREKPLAAMPGVEAIVPVLKRLTKLASSISLKRAINCLHRQCADPAPRKVLPLSPARVRSRAAIKFSPSARTVIKKSAPASSAAAPLNRALCALQLPGITRGWTRFLAEARDKPGCPSSPK